MNKKETIIPLAFVALSLLFVVVSAMVYLSGGKSKKWVAKKMRIGGLLLTLTAAQNLVSAQEIRCYLPATEYSIDFYGSIKPEIIINLEKEFTIKGRFHSKKTSKLSFTIKDQNGFIVQNANALAVDGIFNEKTEDFLAYLNPDLHDGLYILEFFPFDKRDSKSSKYYRAIMKIKLIIKHE